MINFYLVRVIRCLVTVLLLRELEPKSKVLDNYHLADFAIHGDDVIIFVSFILQSHAPGHFLLAQRTGMTTNRTNT